MFYIFLKENSTNENIRIFSLMDNLKNYIHEYYKTK